MKKLLVLLLALSMVFALAACGGKDEPKPSGSGALGNQEDNTSSQGEPAPPDEGDIPEMPDGGEGAATDDISGGQTADYGIDWADIKYLPEGLPKLYDKVSRDESDPDTKAMRIGWYVLPQADMEDIKAKLEQWIGAPLDDLGGLGGMYVDDNMTVNLIYHEEAMTGIEQCSLMVELH